MSSPARTLGQREWFLAERHDSFGYNAACAGLSIGRNIHRPGEMVVRAGILPFYIYSAGILRGSSGVQGMNPFR